MTGRCCFCNLALTDERSTAIGYGKTCADNYGLAWGAAAARELASTSEPVAEAEVRTVRAFSPCGPCLTLGTMTGETAQFYCYAERNGTAKKIRKRTAAHYSRAHIEPCSSCRDHAQTQYPNGYMD